MNVHDNIEFAHSLDSCRLVLSRLFHIAIQNEIDVVSGDFNRAHLVVKEVLDDMQNRRIQANAPNIPKVYVINNLPKSPEVLTVLFVHQPYVGRFATRQQAQAACM